MLRNRQIRFAVTVLAGIGTLAVAADRALAAADTSPANATIVTPIAIANTLSLEFGRIAAGTGVSVVRISTAGARSLVSGDAILVSGGTERAASFDVTGENSAGYDITLDASIVITSGANNMTVDTFVDSVAGSGTLSGAGAQTFTVGADLTVGIAQPAGAYTGTFTATVNYN